MKPPIVGDVGQIIGGCLQVDAAEMHGERYWLAEERSGKVSKRCKE